MIRSIALLAIMAILTGCSSVYYDTLERFGIEKREILVDRVTEARDSQVQAKERFSTALEEFSVLMSYDGGELQQTYDTLEDEFEDSEEEAEKVRERIEAVEEVSRDLFAEWEDEINQYTNAEFREASTVSLRQTRASYDELITSMRNVERRMDPVLNSFRDQVLFLKHNLNARAIASLRGEFTNIENNIAELIRDMETSIQESNRFIEDMNLI